MDIRFLALLAAAALAGAAHAGGEHHHHDHGPRHGGVFIEGKALDFEVVARPELIQVYVGDHGKPVKIEGAKGKLTLLHGGQKTEAELVPVGDRMEARGSFKVGKGTKGIALVTLAGKPAAVARFELK